MVPAARWRVRAAWAMRRGKSKVISCPASARPKGWPFRSTFSTPCSFAPSHPGRSSTDTATGEQAQAGFDWTKPKPLASSPGIRFRSEMSFRSIDEPDRPRGLLRLAPMRHGAGDHRDFGLEVDPPCGIAHDVVGGPEEPVRSALVHQRIGPERGRHLRPPRAPHELHVVHVGRPVEELERPGQGGGAMRGVEQARLHLRGDLPAVQRLLECLLLRQPVRGEIVRDDHEPPVGRAVPQRGDLHDVTSSPACRRTSSPDRASSRCSRPAAAPSVAAKRVRCCGKRVSNMKHMVSSSFSGFSAAFDAPSKALPVRPVRQHAVVQAHAAGDEALAAWRHRCRRCCPSVRT